jgi:asparagine synthase (glutamine-hydrolysing)
MCGISGIIGYGLTEEDFTRELHKMEHRGPDGFGVWSQADGSVRLGHRRLAIIDTDDRANQPMLFEGRYVLVFNGEIYNYIELRSQLEQEGVVFSTRSDTEVLLHMMIRKGPSALTILNGMWAFALYDISERTLFLSRDRLGKKPLYLILGQNRIAFASEMKSLYRYLGRIDYDKEVIDLTMSNFMDAEMQKDTIIRGIEKFPPACYGIYKNGELKTYRYYFPEELLSKRPNYKRFEDAVDEFRSLFESSCSLRMRSDVPVGSALSGGIDSSFVVSTIAKLGFAHSGYKALVSSFPGSFLDETKEAFAVADHAGVPVDAVIVNSKIEPDDILEATYQFEDIAGTAPLPFFQLYNAFRKQGVVVTLDGHGGDELFGGYSFDLYYKLEDDFPDIFKMRKTLDIIDKMYGFQNLITIKSVIPYLKTEIKKRMRENSLSDFFPDGQHFRKRLFHSTFYGMLPTLLRNYDKYSMQAGVEVRMPFLDYRIVEFAFSLPDEYKVRNGFSKAIVRKAAASIVPSMIVNNRVKTGWNSPMGEWFSGPWKQWLMDETSSVEYQNCDLIDQVAIGHTILQLFHSDGEQQIGQKLWLLLQPYLIEKANKKFSSI